MDDTRNEIEQANRLDRILGLSRGEIQELSKREMREVQG